MYKNEPDQDEHSKLTGACSPDLKVVPTNVEDHVSCELASNSDLSEMGPPPPERPQLLFNQLGPPPRIFVAHDGGYGFEICGDREFTKYLQQKQIDPLCHIAIEGFDGAEENTTFYTFITVKSLPKEPHDPFAGPTKREVHSSLMSIPSPDRPPPHPTNKLVDPTNTNTVVGAMLNVLRRGTQCPWMDLNFQFPTLPRIVAPCKPPTLPCCKETLVSFRRICEYPQLTTHELEKVERALGEYEKWRCEVLEKPLEKWEDPRPVQEITIEKDISECVRQVLLIPLCNYYSCLCCFLITEVTSMPCDCILQIPNALFSQL